MPSRSFFIQRPEDALRHIKMLAQGLKKSAIAGWVGGFGCIVMAALLGHFTANPHATATSGSSEISEVTLAAWFMAIALTVFSTLYFVAGWGLSRQKRWSRHLAAGTFLLKVLLCLWLGRGSAIAMFVFLGIATWDFYGLWVLLSNETGKLFGRGQPAPASSYPPATQARQP